jgi:hypothetical protein
LINLKKFFGGNKMKIDRSIEKESQKRKITRRVEYLLARAEKEDIRALPLTLQERYRGRLGLSDEFSDFATDQDYSIEYNGVLFVLSRSEFALSGNSRESDLIYLIQGRKVIGYTKPSRKGEYIEGYSLPDKFSRRIEKVQERREELQNACMDERIKCPEFSPYLLKYTLYGFAQFIYFDLEKKITTQERRVQRIIRDRTQREKIKNAREKLEEIRFRLNVRQLCDKL